MKYKHIIWDFNGTILDDTDAAIKSENTLLNRRNMPLIKNREHYHSIFRFPIKEYYRSLGHDVSPESYDMLAREWVKEYLENSLSSPLCPGVKEALELFATMKLPQTVISMTESGMLQKQIKSLGISQYFTDVVGLDNILAESKLIIAEQWAAKVKPESPLFIGDTTHDLETARIIGADCALVANGHQSRETLLASGGCGIYTSLYALVDALKA
ncbi:Phosphoglycolate phosphatase [bioreactor metagenome]|uniref:Phosphoglycolate phosphatase n=1 Tax=bioreactor metagenome TaxID=1076179 RepID=A0A645E9Y3_9ZZZZ|nr:HAD family hydrolase [Oscillospiraceae bacterium]